LHLPRHYDFQDLRLSPAQTRAKLADMGRKNIVAYQPNNSLHHVDKELIEKVMEEVNGILLLHLAVGLARLGDVNHYNRIRIYRALVERYAKPDQFLLSLLPLATRMAGPREALWQALIHRNYGANHMIMSRNHASPVNSSESRTYNNLPDAQELVGKYSDELGVKMLSEQERHEDASKVSEGQPTVFNSNTQIGTEYPNNGQTLPGWYTQPDVAEILAEIYPPRHRQGVCIWFTGLSGAGKSTTAEMLTWLLLEHGRRVTVLDGDVLRTHLSKGLGFSKEDRDTNVRRIGFVASELVRLGGVVICAVVSPYRVARNDVRNMVGEDQFVEVFVNTPLEVCEARDVKGMYARARRGGLNGFTGIDDPYEPPHHPEITLDTVYFTPQENANFIIEYLIEQGFVQARKKQIF
jgi:sulfate adenylyltransferase